MNVQRIDQDRDTGFGDGRYPQTTHTNFRFRMDHVGAQRRPSNVLAPPPRRSGVESLHRAARRALPGSQKQRGRVATRHTVAVRVRE